MRVLLKKLYYGVLNTISFIKEERRLSKGSSLPKPGLTKRIWLISKGFYSNRMTTYGLNEQNYKEYLSDYRKLKTPLINKPYHVVLNDKFLFYKLFKGTNHLPLIYGRITEDGIYINDLASCEDDVLRLLDNMNGIIIKPNDGGGGKGVLKVDKHKGGFFINSKEATKEEVMLVLKSLDNHIIMEMVIGASYSRKIFQETLNTIRVQMVKTKQGEIHVAGAVHKFGSSKTIPADNAWKGGITANIDLNTGVIHGPKLHSDNSRMLEEISYHPDTKAMIEGVKIPGWHAMIDELIRITQQFEQLRYVGWDIAMTDDGFAIIEGNNHTDVYILQIHKPLLDDQLVRRFYDYELANIY